MPIDLSPAKMKGDFFRQNQREILIGFCALLAVLVSWIFPNKLFGESFWSSFFLFLIFPGLIILFLLKEPLKNFGLSWGNSRSGLIFSALLVIIFVLINYLIVSRAGLRGQLPVNQSIVGNYWYFLVFELLIALPLHFFWEFFFRGFLQFGLEKKLGIYSILPQAFLQTVLALKGPWLFSSLIFSSSLAAGLVARKSRSVIYSFLSLWIISVSLDIMIIRAIHQMAV
jgi:membrane protease YdiL (CAAX protease family)